jgi:hypothetical protein
MTLKENLAERSRRRRGHSRGLDGPGVSALVHAAAQLRAHAILAHHRYPIAPAAVGCAESSTPKNTTSPEGTARQVSVLGTYSRVRTCVRG